MREVQTALGLVVGTGIAIVPVSVERLRRENVVFRTLKEEGAVSPIIASPRKGDRLPEGTLILRLISEIYREKGIMPAKTEPKATNPGTGRQPTRRS
jgi:LysR family transcriptional regulator, benzoate and cis,cis-muconate-responsive activator of ben and cat genes